MGVVVKMKLFGAALGCAVVNAQMPCGGNNPDPDVYPQPCPDEGKVTYQWCKNNYPDWIAVADGTTSQDEIQNPHIAPPRAPRDNWEEEFKRLAMRLLDQDRPVANNGYHGTTNKEISLTLLSYMQSLWPMDGWVIVVANANGYGDTSNGDGKIQHKCSDYNGIGSGQPDADTCFDHWFTGCRERPLNGSSSKQCRNMVVGSDSKHRIAIGVQVNKRIEHMEHVDHKHVMWWASHADGCFENGTCGKELGDNPSASDIKTQIKSKYGVSGADLDLREGPMRRMAAKLIWQHYRQALDKEFLYINDDSCANWDTLITFCSDETEPTGNKEWADIAWETVNIDDHYHTDYQQFEIGLKDDWYGNNGVAQCVTLYVTPFSH